MKYEERPHAVSDEEALEAWNTIMQLASSACLIVQAYSGTATLAVPQEQRAAGIRRGVLDAHVKQETESHAGHKRHRRSL